jgi:putative colanic acid biosynthesis UDP-glucose lipid carrier transferase
MHERIESSTLPRQGTIMGKRLVSNESQVARSLMKKLLDVTVATTALIFLLPALLTIALMIKLDSPGPVFFRQRRTGLNSKVFHIYKFRSMTVAEDGDKVVQAKVGDQRVTRIGKILRRTSLDEIPQLINIVLGDMSLVGPRPHAMSHDAEFAAVVSNYGSRFHARPGLTGLAQVNGYRGEIITREDLEKRIELDIAYIQNWSIGKDILIVLKTVPCLFGHKNAY